MKKTKLLSLILAMVMAFSTISTTAFAAENTEEPPAISAYATNAEAYGIGRWYVGPVTFTKHNGGSYHTVTAGSQMRICIAYKPVDNIVYSPCLWVYCYQYGGKLMKQYYTEYGMGYNDSDSNGYCYYISDWFNITPGTDYRLVYDVGTVGGPAGDRRVSCHVWYDIK